MSHKSTQRGLSLLVMFMLTFSLVSNVFAAPLRTTAPMAAAPESKSSTKADSCGYPYGTGKTATLFNESTITRSAAVFGMGLNARIGIFANDEKAALLGVNGASANTTSPQHVSNPALGDKSLKDPSGRPFYPALYLTDITGDASNTSGDWQKGGSPVTHVDDVFGTWATATLSGGSFSDTLPPAKNHWNLGPGADTPPAGTTSFDEGYGTEFRWNASGLGLTPGHSYRVQVLAHDGDQNKVGGDAGEQCINLSIPLPPTVVTQASGPVDNGESIFDKATLSGGHQPTGTMTFNLYGPNDATCSKGSIFTSTKAVNGTGDYTSDSFKPSAPGTYRWIANFSGGDANNPDTSNGCNESNEASVVRAADISVAKTADDASVSAGKQIGFKVTITNAGSGAATGITFSDDLPAGDGISWSLVGSPSDWKITGSAPNQALKYVPTTLAGNTSSSVAHVVSDTTTESCKAYPNSATVGSANDGGNTDSAKTTVDCPDIHAEKTVDGEHSTNADPGDTLHYAIKVTNNGDAAGTADVSDDISAILAHATIGTISDGGTLAGDVITWPQFSLDAKGGTKTLTFEVTLDSVFPNGKTELPNAVVVVGTGSNCLPKDNEDADCNTETTVKA